MQLYSRIIGIGEPLIILHGLFGMSDNWLNIAKKFSENYKVYIPDLRNHGRSPHSDKINYAVMADDIKELIIKNSIKNPIIIGHSMGGKVAMQYALENNKSIKALIIADIAPSKYEPQHSHINLMQAMLAIEPSKYSKYSDIEKQLEKSIKSKQLINFILKNLKRDDNQKLIWKLNIKAIFENYNSFGDRIISNNIFEGKTLFIKAENSDYLKTEQYSYIYKLFPKAEFKIMPKVSHWLHAEAPNSFIDIVDNFLTNN